MDQHVGPGFLANGGETGALMRAQDWSVSPLGNSSTWPQPLKTLVSVMLAANQPMFIAWGPERTLLYNDPYAGVLSAKHPAALGCDLLEVWSEIRSDLVPIVEEAYAGRPVHMDDIAFVMRRNGYPEETHFAFSYTPVRDEAGRVAGMFCACTETTGQVLAERRLAAETARQRRLFERAPGFITILRGPDLVFEFVNDAFTRLFGSRDFIGRTVREAFPDLRGQGFYELLDRTYATGERFVASHIRILLQHRPGAAEEERFLDVIYEPILDDAGVVTGLFIEGYDVTEAHRASEAVRKLNETLESRVAELAAERDQIWRLSRTPFVVCDTEGRWLSASPAWTDILGWTEAELVGRTSEWMQHSDDWTKTRDKVVDAAAGEFVLNFINRFRDRDGHYHSFSWTAVAEGDRLFCVARDVTEEMVRAAELRLHANIVQSDPSPVCAFDTDYRLIAFNQAHNDEFHRVNGFHTRVGDVFPDLFIPEQRPVMRALMSRALSGELFTVVEEFGKPELGRPYWEISYTPLRDEMGQIIGAFHHARDISGRLHAEAELAAAQEALRQSQKMEAVGQLTGGLAHDFNNLLAGISGSLELMQTRMAQGRTNDLERYITAAQGASKRAAALTHRLLAFTRQQTLDPKPTDVNRLVAGMDELVRRTVGPGVTVEVAGAAGLWATLVDPNQLENALLNLCINARDAMPDGGRLTIETGNKWLDERTAQSRDLPAGQYVSLCVSDTGTGMRPEVVRRAFDPFFTTKPIGMGTGLGLSMIYGFVQQSGGQARIYSELGQGTMVCLYLPRQHGKAEAEDEQPGQVDVPRAEAGETVLVVDDEPTVRMLVAEVLQDLGYMAIEAADGPAGLQVLRSDARIDLLITDVGLPGGMNGRQVADAGRAVRPELRVLFITGYAENAVLSHGHLDPGMHVLIKPFAVDALAIRIKELIVGG